MKIFCEGCHALLMANATLEEAAVTYPGGCPHCSNPTDNGRVGRGTANIDKSLKDHKDRIKKPSKGFRAGSPGE